MEPENLNSAIVVASDSKPPLKWLVSSWKVILLILTLVTLTGILFIFIYKISNKATLADSFHVGSIYQGEWKSSKPVSSRLTILKRDGDNANICYQWKESNSSGQIIVPATISSNKTLSWGSEAPNTFYFTFTPTNNGGLVGSMEYNNTTSTIQMTRANKLWLSQLSDIFSPKNDNLVCSNLQSN